MPEGAVPTPPAQAMGNLFESYSPEGAMGGMFAPAYIKGYAPSEKAVADWQAANHGLTSADVDASRMPAEWTDPDAGVVSKFGMGPYGAGRIPDSMTLGAKGGSVDPEALRVLAQGGHYDMNARRDAIAQRLSSNSSLQSAAAAAKAKPWWLGASGGGMGLTPFFVDPAAGG